MEGMPEFWAYVTAALMSENCAEVGATVTTDTLALLITVLLLAGDDEAPELLETVDDPPVMIDVSVTELNDTVDPLLEEALAEETSDELPVEDVAAEEADDDKLTDELAAPAIWAASEP
jgi:hypothetical protein